MGQYEILTMDRLYRVVYCWISRGMDHMGGDIEMSDIPKYVLKKKLDELLKENERLSKIVSQTMVGISDHVGYANELRSTLREAVKALETVNPWCLVSHKHVTCDFEKVIDIRNKLKAMVKE